MINVRGVELAEGRLIMDLWFHEVCLSFVLFFRLHTPFDRRAIENLISSGYWKFLASRFDLNVRHYRSLIRALKRILRVNRYDCN